MKEKASEMTLKKVKDKKSNNWQQYRYIISSFFFLKQRHPGFFSYERLLKKTLKSFQTKTYT